MNIPKNLKYTTDHEWVDVNGAVATIGITDFAQGELGDIIYLDVTAAVGDVVNAGDVLGTIEAVKTVSEIYSPISGTITEINTGINDVPSVINQDPYEKGWMIRIEPSNGDELLNLMNDSAYSESIGQ
ncbi:MAG: glycine cleavage system protein GcvH [Ignavibacteria bacterium]|jgi:glycine cleavage system H protein|nr:glycine cleavage system protein GcvH [Ignavibacteria bacterium]